jgi:hypothetical protein
VCSVCLACGMPQGNPGAIGVVHRFRVNPARSVASVSVIIFYTADLDILAQINFIDR